MPAMTEKQTRDKLLMRAREQGYEKPIREILRKADEALKYASSEDQREIITLQAISEIDAYFSGQVSNLNNLLIKDISQATIDKFNKR